MISIIRLVVCISLYFLTSFFIKEFVPYQYGNIIFALIVYFFLLFGYFHLDNYFIKPSEKELNMLFDMKKHGFIIGFIGSYYIEIIFVTVYAGFYFDYLDSRY